MRRYTALIDRPLVVPVLLFSLVAAVYWKLVLPGEKYVWFDHYDMCQLEIPRLDFVARNLHRGHFPLWDPHSWAGQPVLGSAQPGVVFPLTLAFLLAPLRNGAVAFSTLNWLFLALHFIAAGLCFFLYRDLGLGRLSSALGAASFSCAGFFGSIPWLDIGNAVALTPAVILFLLRLWRGKRMLQSAALLGASLGLSWLSGHHEVPLIQSYAVVIGTIAIALSKRNAKLVACMALALTLAALIGAVQLLPMYEYGRNARRWVGTSEPIDWQARIPYSVHERYSLPWQNVPGLLAPIVNPDQASFIFVGLTACVLAATGLRFGWRDWNVRAIALLGFFGLLYALGGHTPFHRILYAALPMIDKARTPMRAVFLLTFAVSVLAAYGAQFYMDRRPSWRWSLPSLLVLTAAACTLQRSLAPLLPAAIFCGLALSGRRLKRPAVGVGLIALTVFDLSAVAEKRLTPLQQSVCAARMQRYGDLVATIRSEPQFGRVAVDWNEILTNLGDIYGVDQLQSFAAAVPWRILRHELQTPRAQELFGVTHRVSGSPAENGDILAARSADGMYLFRKRTALPRVWISHEIRHLRDDDALRRAIQDPQTGLERTTLVLGDLPPVSPCAAAETVSMYEPDPGTIVITAHLACRGLVNVSDVLYPGWNASVDGQPAQLFEVYGAFRGIIVESGKHTITMSYEPLSVRGGTALTAAGAIACLLLTWIGRRKRA